MTRLASGSRFYLRFPSVPAALTLGSGPVRARFVNGGLLSSLATPPPVPSATLTAVDADAALDVAVTNPLPTSGEPDTAYNEVWIDDGAGFERRATYVTPGSVWRYHTPVSGRAYTVPETVQVVAVGSNGTKSVSGTVVNLITNPSFETGFAGWLDSSHAEPLSQDSTATFPESCGAWSARVTADGVGTNSFGFAEVPVVPDTTTYTVSGWVQTPFALTNPGTRTRQIDAICRAADGTSTGYFGGVEEGPASGTGRVSNTFTTPPGTEAVEIRLYNGSAVAGEYVRWDGILITEGDVLHDYFDGDTPDTPLYRHTWTGTPHASTSVRTPRGVLA